MKELLQYVSMAPGDRRLYEYVGRPWLQYNL